jgi:hypothetical protein
LTSEETKPQKKSVTDDARLWGSHGDIKYKHDDHHIEKPDASKFIQMRKETEGDSNRVDEYLPGCDPSGSSFGRQKKGPKKKWTPTPTEENARPDEWLGSPGRTRRSWAPKSPSSFKPPVVHDSDEEKEKVPEAPTVELAKADETVEGSEPIKEPAPRPSLEKAHKSTSAIEIVRPDVTSFMEMRNVDDAASSRLDEYLPGTDPSGGSFGRQKKDKPKKKWNATPTEENGRPDEWMGSAGKAKKSWKVKS